MPRASVPRLDRRIGIILPMPGHRDAMTGRWVPGDERTINVWAAREDIETTRNVEVGGARPTADRQFTVRWRDDLWATEPVNLAVIDEGQRYPVINRVEHTAAGRFRRRWMTLETKGGL